MMFIDNPYNDAGFNLAAEEYLLNTSANDVIMLWQNNPSVIMGRHQDIRAEVNLSFVRKHHIPVLRRRSGGGTVYHDRGNLNLTFIQTNPSPDFATFSERIQELLNEEGIQTQADHRNALFIDGRKISGSAQFLGKGKVLFHATLLYSTDLNKLRASLDSPQTETSSLPTHYIQSVRSPVTNICEHLTNADSVEVFRKRIANRLLRKEPTCTPYTFSREDLAAITQLKNEKYTNNYWDSQA
jgi:lipoate---protein ligase